MRVFVRKYPIPLVVTINVFSRFFTYDVRVGGILVVSLDVHCLNQFQRTNPQLFNNEFIEIVMLGYTVLGVIF